ncbi:MAG: formate--tetrahydrofolate ligase [Planctomycetes bacterium]|nr:formate--tetrahydrofolate ligase [Planctomycetota bacterium]MCC7173478.1 formate--tetrahydrofolate ligase [Planctomycetota bacterium]
MPTDFEIASQFPRRPMPEIGAKLGLTESDLIPYGRDVAKVDLAVLERPRARATTPRLVLVSAITPTPAGEGKTTTTIGLGQALAKLGESVCLALREPSLGPCLGVKGGATGGGYSQIMPAGRINLHFTGDFHAVTSAHNLLGALLDNHVHHGNELRIDPRRISWRRVMDMNDRALRNVIIALGGKEQGFPRETGFDITAASEVMAMLCLAEGFEDLRRRIDRTLVAFTFDGEPVTAGKLKGTGAMLALLRDALAPNLVQSLEGVPALVHGGPFANIAHGCNSVLATRLAMHTADWTVTEAGFAFDLGAEKFFDIKCRSAGLQTAAVVLVATVRALKMHGGVRKEDLGNTDAAAVVRGLPNLEKHIENIRIFGQQPIVALNRFATDSEAELDAVEGFCDRLGVPFATSDHHARGGDGALPLARLVVEHARGGPRPVKFLYEPTDTVPDKILKVARSMYGASKVTLTKTAQRDLRDIEKLGYAHLPICIAKTQNSLSDDPALRGRPRDFEVTVRAIQINSGAGFLVVLTGEMMRMPGLPEHPLAEQFDVIDGRIVGMG